MTFTDGTGKFHFCSWCAQSINTKISPWVCDNNECVKFNKHIDPKTGDLKNV